MNLFFDLEKYAALHPLITAVQVVDEPATDLTTWEILERPFSFLPIKIRYRATVDASEERVHYAVAGVPLSRIEMTYDFSNVDDEVVSIGFSLELDAPFWVRAILSRKMLAAQDSLIANIRASVR